MTITDLPGSTFLPNATGLLHSIDDDRLAPGTKVEVRSRFNAKWARGFEIVDTSGELYRLRRLSDGAELPVLFVHDDVRPEKRNNNWWY